MRPPPGTSSLDEQAIAHPRAKPKAQPIAESIEVDVVFMAICILGFCRAVVARGASTKLNGRHNEF